MVEIGKIFSNKVCWKLITFFTSNPSIEISQASIIKKLQISKISAIKWLKVIENRRLIHKKIIGRTYLYRLNKENPIVKQIKILYNVSDIISKLPIIENIELYMFGSCARGENHEKSDIDILVIGKDRSVIRKIEEADERIKITFFSSIDWSNLARKDPAFYERIEKDKIKLIP